MFEVALDSSSGIKVEVCRICEFVWFDAGETQTLQARPLPEAKPQVVLPQEAREAIALAKVQQLAEQAHGGGLRRGRLFEAGRGVGRRHGKSAQS